MPSKNIKFIIKFKIESNSKNLNPKISTVLSQRRINSSEFFNFFKEKLSLLEIREDVNILLKIFIFVFELDDYVVYIKMPSLSTLINHFFYLKKNYNWPGFFFNKMTKKQKYFNYILTPYILYEIIKYQWVYSGNDNIFLSSHFKKNVDSLKSKGINLYIV